MSPLLSAPQTRASGSGYPALTDAQLYYVGRNSLGRWVVRDAAGRSGGILVNRLQASKFAMSENGRRPERVIVVPGVMKLDLQ